MKQKLRSDGYGKDKRKRTTEIVEDRNLRISMQWHAKVIRKSKTWSTHQKQNKRKNYQSKVETHRAKSKD